MSQTDSINSDSLGSNDEFSRLALTKINELKEMLEDKGDDYVTIEKKRLFRELVLIINLATLQRGEQLCLDLL
jgi:hypothetical protein